MRKLRILKSFVLLLALALASCSTNQEYSYNARSEIAAGTPAKDRPGLATTFGESRGSKVRAGEFERANALTPWLLASVFYNDAEGARAAGTGWGIPFVSLNRLVKFGVRNAEGQPYYIDSKFRIFGKPEYRVVGKSGDRYELLIKNESDTRLEVVASVDGLDVLDGKPAAVTKRGYVVEAGKTLVIEGWRTSMDSVAAFRFGTVRDSYAEKKYGDARNVGVIGLAIFHPQGSHPRPYLEKEIRRRKQADPFPNSGGFAEPPAR